MVDASASMSTDDLLIRPPTSETPQRTPKSYDFERPLAFSARQLRAAEAVHDVLARHLAHSLSERLLTPVEVHCTGIHEVLAADFERSRTAPTALFRMRLDATLPLVFGLDLTPAFGLFLVERHLGGTDGIGATNRALTALEHMVVERHWLPGILAAFSDAWHAPIPQPDGFDSQPSRLPIAESDAPVVSADFEIIVDEASTQVAFCYPAETMRALNNVYEHAVADEPAPPSGQRLDDVPLDVQVELGRTTLSVADLLRLAPGDVLTLSRRADAPLPVHAGDRLLFDARPGVSGRNIALQILALHSVPTAADLP